MMNHRSWDTVLLVLGKKACPSLQFSASLLANLPDIQVVQCPHGMDRLSFLMGYLTGSQLSDTIFFLTNAKRDSLEKFTSDDFTINIVREKKDVEVEDEEDDDDDEEEEEEEEEEDEEEEEEQEEDDEEHKHGKKKDDPADPGSVDKAMKEAFNYLLASPEGQKLLATTLSSAMGGEKKEKDE
jgi:hypothetical protein